MKKLFVSVNFKSTPFKSYHFLTDMEFLNEGDIVVVDTRNGYELAVVEGYVEIPKSGIEKFKWVVQRVDFLHHNERLEKEARLETLKKKMEERRKKLEEIQIFALLSKEDPEMKALFDEYMSNNTL